MDTSHVCRRLLTTKCLFACFTCILLLMEISLVINWVCAACIITVWRDVLAPIFISGSMQRRPVHNASQLVPFIQIVIILDTSYRRRRLLTTNCFFNGSTCILSVREISLVINWVCLTCIITVRRDVLASTFIRGSMQRRPVHIVSK